MAEIKSFHCECLLKKKKKNAFKIFAMKTQAIARFSGRKSAFGKSSNAKLSGFPSEIWKAIQFQINFLSRMSELSLKPKYVARVSWHRSQKSEKRKIRPRKRT